MTRVCRKEKYADSGDGRSGNCIVNLYDSDLLLAEVQRFPHTILAISHPGDKQEQTITKTQKKNMQTSDKNDWSQMQMHWELISDEK